MSRKKISREETARKVKKLTGGVVSTVTDLVLFATFYGFEIGFGGTKSFRRSGQEKAGEQALEALSEFNSKTIKRALRTLSAKGLVQATREALAEPKITAAGRRRLKGKIPQYDGERTWDGVLYTVTYDVPIEKNYDRNLLREFLRRIGAGPLQDSVWITPYNPKTLIKEFVNERGLHGTILVSSLGKGGAIGDISTAELLEKVYELSGLSARYEQFIAEYKVGKCDRLEASFVFLAILEDDPQLPFELLPDYWAGDKAYRHFLKIVGGKR